MELTIPLNTSYWVWIGTIYLIILTYKDFKNKMLVDDRHNYMMIGFTFSLLSHVSRNIFYTLSVVFIVIILYYFLKKKKVLGEADLKSFSWIFLGFAILNPAFFIWYCIFFAIVTIIYHLIKLGVYKFAKKDYRQPTPFYIVLLICFVFTSWLFKLYIQ